MFKPSRGLWHLKQILAPNEWIHKSVGYSVKGQMCVMATRKLNLSQITIHHQALPKKLCMFAGDIKIKGILDSDLFWVK